MSRDVVRVDVDGAGDDCGLDDFAAALPLDFDRVRGGDVREDDAAGCRPRRDITTGLMSDSAGCDGKM